LTLIEKFKSLASVFVINISSPNTKGLRDLQDQKNLFTFLFPLAQAAHKINTPLLLKLSPDLSDLEFSDAINAACDADIDGFVLTNTTVSRQQGSKFPVEGGVSGLAVKELSLKFLKDSIKILGPRRAGKLIVSTGGIFTPEDAKQRLDLGADLVQMYTSLVFHGPHLLSQIIKKLASIS
jgi:dihydroorotate dehydrogenase